MQLICNCGQAILEGDASALVAPSKWTIRVNKQTDLTKKIAIVAPAYKYIADLRWALTWLLFKIQELKPFYKGFTKISDLCYVEWCHYDNSESQHNQQVTKIFT